MNTKLTGEVTLTFIRGGISVKGNQYLQVSNGRTEMFVIIPKQFEVTDKTFADFEENDSITMEVEVTVGSEKVTLISLL